MNSATEIAAIRTEVQEITARLEDAATRIDSGISLDLSDLGPRAAALCENILKLPPADALGLLMELNAAVGKLDQITDQLKS